MAGRLVKRSAAERDLSRIGRYLQEQASLKTAHKFLFAVERALRSLAEMPTLGSLVETDHPKLSQLRLWTIREFKNYVIIYLPLPNGIEALRVVHGASDFEALMERLQVQLD